MEEPRIEYTVRQLLERIDNKLDKADEKLDKVAAEVHTHEHTYVTPRYMWASLLSVGGLGVGILKFLP